MFYSKVYASFEEIDYRNKKFPWHVWIQTFGVKGVDSKQICFTDRDERTNYENVNNIWFYFYNTRLSQKYFPCLDSSFNGEGIINRT